MRTILRIGSLLAFIGLLIIGCSDKSISPVGSTATNDNSVSLQKGSSVSGAEIYRYGDNVAFWFADQESGLVLTLGINDVSNFCAGTGKDMFNFKDIWLPNADPSLSRLIQQINGKDITALIWKPNPWPPDSIFSSFCNFIDFIGGAAPMAMGTANFIYTDNDVIAWAQDNKNSNAYGYKATGTLVSPDGQAYNLNLVNRAMWDGVDATRQNYIFKLQLTPIGK